MGRAISAWGHLLQYREDGARVPSVQSSVYTPRVGHHPQQLHRRVDRARTNEYHKDYCNGGGPPALGRGKTGGANTVTLKHWLLHCGEASDELRQIHASMVEWIDNLRPSWAAYYSLMTIHLIVLDNQPGVKPVGIW